MATAQAIRVIDDGTHRMGTLAAYRPLWTSHGAGGSILSWLEYRLGRPALGVAVRGCEDPMAEIASTTPASIMVSARWMDARPDLLPAFGEHVVSEEGVLLAVHADHDILKAWCEGDLEQVGLSDEVYNYPQTPFVASFVGENNPFYGKVISKEKNLVQVECQGKTFIANSGNINNSKKHNFSKGQEVILFIRPESIFIKNKSNKLDNIFKARLKTIEFEGNLKNIYLNLDSKLSIKFSVPNAVDTSELTPNKEIELTFSSEKAIVLPKGSLAVD